MAEFNSDQLTNENASPQVKNDANVASGKVRRVAFTLEVPVGGIASGDTINLVNLRAGERIYGGEIVHEDVSATGTISIGDGTTADKYSAATGMAAAGAFVFADEISLYNMEELSVDTTLVATVGTAALDAGKKIQGWADVVAN